MRLHKVNFTWTVPCRSKPIGMWSPSAWEADPDAVNSADANSTNDYAQLNLNVGRLPTALANSSSVQTNQVALIDASQSFDEDGGDVFCKFAVTFDDGSRQWDSQEYYFSILHAKLFLD